MIIPKLVITVYTDRSFIRVQDSHQRQYLSRRQQGIDKASAQLGRKVSTILCSGRGNCEDQDAGSAATLEAATDMIKGTARSMGVTCNRAISREAFLRDVDRTTREELRPRKAKACQRNHGVVRQDTDFACRSCKERKELPMRSSMRPLMHIRLGVDGNINIADQQVSAQLKSSRAEEVRARRFLFLLRVPRLKRQ